MRGLPRWMRWFLALSLLSGCLFGCAGRRAASSTDSRPCEGDGCWTYQYVRQAHEWAWCRQQDSETVCRW